MISVSEIRHFRKSPSHVRLDDEINDLRATFEKTRNENFQLLLSSAQLEERMKKLQEK